MFAQNGLPGALFPTPNVGMADQLPSLLGLSADALGRRRKGETAETATSRFGLTFGGANAVSQSERWSELAYLRHGRRPRLVFNSSIREH